MTRAIWHQPTARFHIPWHGSQVNLCGRAGPAGSRLLRGHAEKPDKDLIPTRDEVDQARRLVEEVRGKSDQAQSDTGKNADSRKD